MCCYGDCTNKRVSLMNRIRWQEYCCRECESWICRDCISTIFSVNDDDNDIERIIDEDEGEIEFEIPEPRPEVECSGCETVLAPETAKQSPIRLLSALWSKYQFWLLDRRDNELKRMLERGCVVHYDGDTTGCSTRTKYFPSKRCPGCKKAMCERCADYHSRESVRFCDRCRHRL